LGGFSLEKAHGAWRIGHRVLTKKKKEIPNRLLYLLRGPYKKTKRVSRYLDFGSGLPPSGGISRLDFMH
jgi:hypothetical protein